MGWLEFIIYDKCIKKYATKLKLCNFAEKILVMQ